MIRDKNGIYRFTEEEKADIKWNRQESYTVKATIQDWYKTVCSFPLYIHRSKSADWGPFETRGEGKKASDCTIVKYGIYGTSNKAVLDMFKMKEEDIEKQLQPLLHSMYRLMGCTSVRVKAVRRKDKFDNLLETSGVQVIFVTEGRKYLPVKGDKIVVVDYIEDIGDLPW